MPSTATITAFYNFTANTKARAAQVQGNFDMFRGHIIPIEPLTATSSDVAYDLGADSHRWRTAYAKTLDLVGHTSTAGLTIERDNTTTSQAFVFKVGGTERFRIDEKGYYGANSRFVDGANALATISATYLQGNYARSTGIDAFKSTVTSTTLIVGGTLSLITIGRPVLIRLNPKSAFTTISSSIVVYQQTTGVTPIAELYLYRDSQVIAGFYLRVEGTDGNRGYWPATSISYIDFPSVASTITSVYSIRSLCVNTNTVIEINNCELTAFEL